jgi:hypothetical protein
MEPKEGSTPYKALNGEHCKEVWKQELYHNSARGGHLSHCLGVELTTHLG